MSRIGNQVIKIPAGVQVTQTGQQLNVVGPKGSLSVALFDSLAVEIENNQIKISPATHVNSKDTKVLSLWGLLRSLIYNSVLGVHQAFTKSLSLVGVGYKSKVENEILILNLGFSHDINYKIPQGITITVSKNTEIKINGIDKQQVGQVASDIRSFRPPEPYKGKGVRYTDEHVRRKEGKKKKK